MSWQPEIAALSRATEIAIAIAERLRAMPCVAVAEPVVDLELPCQRAEIVATYRSWWGTRRSTRVVVRCVGGATWISTVPFVRQIEAAARGAAGVP